jgi:hypothetical protein
VQDRAQVADRPEVGELGRVSHRPHRLDDPARRDVEQDGVEQAATRVGDQRAGGAVDLGAPNGHVELAALAAEAGQQRHHPVAADDRARPHRRHAAVVADHGDVLRQELDQAVQVALVHRLEEAVGERLAAVGRGLRPAPLLAHVAAGAHGQLTAVVLAARDDLGDLAVAVVEDVVQQEDRALDRGQPLEHEQERHRDRVGVLHDPGPVRNDRVGQERFRQPRPDVALAPHAGRAQVVDAEAGRDRAQVRLGVVDLDAVGDRALVADVGLLHHVLGLDHAAEHAVGDREEQRAQGVVGLGHRRRLNPRAGPAPRRRPRRRGRRWHACSPACRRA